MSLPFRFAIVLALSGLFALPRWARASDFTLTIARQYSSPVCTSGYLAVNGTIVAYTLELPWRGNQPFISAIPAGTYPGTLRYDHSDQWRIELRHVNGHDNIEIHTGNTPGDSQGCIIIGKQLAANLCGIVGGTSRSAYRDLKIAFYGSATPVMTPDKSITVVVQDGGGSGGSTPP
jgi:hypothetical protein